MDKANLVEKSHKNRKISTVYNDKIDCSVLAVNVLVDKEAIWIR